MKHPTKKASEMSTKELASYIDYSVLKPEFTEEQIIELTKDGVELGCATICINPGYMDLCKPYVEGSDTKLCPVCDFPLEQVPLNLKSLRQRSWLITMPMLSENLML